jgi:hypothetical protein
VAFSCLLALLMVIPAPTPAAPTLADAGTPPERFLEPDGTLNIPADFTGNIDPTGYQLVSASGEAPRFAPAEESSIRNGDGHAGNWDLRFFEAGMDNQIAALVWDGHNLYVGGSFTIAGDCVDCNHIARWDGDTRHALNNRLNSWVHTLSWDGDSEEQSLHAGGEFTGSAACYQRGSAVGCCHSMSPGCTCL